MADRFILSHLRRLPLFARLTPQQVEWVANAVQVFRYEPGEAIFNQGEVLQGLVMIVSGRGALVQRGLNGVEQSAGLVQEGDYLNEPALFAELTSPATLRALETSIILFLSRQAMQAILAQRPDIKAGLQPRMPARQTGGQPVPGQRANETTLIETRRHWWSFAGRILGLGLLFIAIWLLEGFLSQAIPDVPWLSFGVLGTLATGLLGVYLFFEWRNDVLIVTDQRVINRTHTIVTFRTQVNEIGLDSILEVQVDIPSTDVFARLLGYGNLHIKTAGTAANLELHDIPKPSAVQNAIFASRKRVQETRAAEARDANRDAIRAEIERFIRPSPAGSDPSTAVPVRGMTPEGLFSTRFTNEKGETVYRKHLLIWLGHVFLPGAVTLGGLIVLFLGLLPAVIPLLIMALGAVVFYLLDWDWRNDLYIVGDQTITLIHKRPLFLQDQKDQILLSQVDNVVSDTSGLLNTILRVGDVKLFLTGSEIPKLFRGVHNPQQIQDEISRRQRQAADKKRESETRQQHESIVEYLKVYHETLGGQSPAASDPAGSVPPSSPRPAEPPPRVRDRSRPPGVPRARRDPPNS